MAAVMIASVVIESAWIVACVVLVLKGHTGWAVACFIAALFSGYTVKETKQ